MSIIAISYCNSIQFRSQSLPRTGEYLRSEHGVNRRGRFTREKQQQNKRGPYGEQGIDVSKHNDKIDCPKVAADGASLWVRIGYGSRKITPLPTGATKPTSGRALTLGIEVNTSICPQPYALDAVAAAQRRSRLYPTSNRATVQGKANVSSRLHDIEDGNAETRLSGS